MKRDFNLKVISKSHAEMMVVVQYFNLKFTIKLVKNPAMMVSYWLFYLQRGRENFIQDSASAVLKCINL